MKGVAAAELKRVTALPHPVLLLLLALATLLGAPVGAAEPRVVPGEGITLIPIPAGTFMMGSPATEVGRYSNEGPQTKVTLSRSFWLGRTEVTQAQWRAVMGTTVPEQIQRMLADPTRYDMGEKQPETLRAYYAHATDGSASLRFNDSDDAPMYFVSWDEATEFCQRLTQRERAAGGVRIPTADGSGMGVRVSRRHDHRHVRRQPGHQGRVRRADAGRDCVVRRQQQRRVPRVRTRHIGVAAKAVPGRHRRAAHRGHEEAERMGTL